MYFSNDSITPARHATEVDLVLAQHAEHLQVELRVDVAPQHALLRRRRAARQPGLGAVAVHEQLRRDVGQHGELELLRHEPLQQVQAVAVHRPDVHLGQAGDLAEFPLDDRQNALLQLGRRLLGERERDDVARLDPGLGQDRRDPLGDDLRLAGPRAGDDLQRLVEARDRLGLGSGVRGHGPDCQLRSDVSV